MNLAPEELAGALAARLLPAYLVSGDEPLLAGEAADAIRASARSAGCEEREVFFIERGNAVWDAILQAAQALSLFTARRLIEIRMPGGKPGTAGSAALLRLLQAAGTDLTVLIITEQLDRDSQGAEWVRALQARGAWVQVRPIARERLPQWLAARMAAAGLSASGEALELLAERSEGNLLAARQEIDKLSLLLPRGTRVSLADVVAGSADSARFDVFQLAQAVRAADAARCLRILVSLRAEGAEPTLVLWVLVRELRSMTSERATGTARAPLLRLVRRAARADRTIKGLVVGDGWDELALLAVELTGVGYLPLMRAAGA
ncbi:MAG TPA: DNA polymerase III subunit delta [Steroidobacteraceae bacterium]|jgi:DNA polymerase-3 subunit delta|nr:DNA polymerase III subunit delta [Steroidobacteraceae bacterium]